MEEALAANSGGGGFGGDGGGGGSGDWMVATSFYANRCTRSIENELEAIGYFRRERPE